MKILHIARQFYPCIGGVENVVMNVAIKQIALGHEVSVLTLDRCFSDDTRLSREDYFRGIKIRRIPFWGIKRYPLAFSVLKYIGSQDILHIHCVDFFIDLLVLTKFIHGKKIVLHTHGGFFHTTWLYFFKKLYFHAITRFILKGCDKVIAVSKNDLEVFSRITNNLVLIENGVDFDKFSALHKKRSIGRLLYIGRVDHHKRIDHLIKTLVELKKGRRYLKLYILGPSWNNCADGLKKYALECGVADNIIWRGSISEAELMDELAEATLFVSASEYEGFGISAVEAMASGTICLLNKIEAFEKILGEMSPDFTVNFEDAFASANKITTLLDLSEEEKIYKATLLKTRAKEFSWDIAIEKLERVYDSFKK